jgi:adenylate cyclase
MNPRNFFAELKRRNVYKVAIAYAVVGWLLMQVASQIFPFFEIPNWTVRLVVLLLIIGFPVALILAWAFELTPEGIKRTEVAEELPTKSAGSHAWIYIVIIAGALSVGVFFLGRYTTSKHNGGVEVPTKSIAVLPFENLSRDPDNAYFADGIQEEILTRLSKIADLKVISRTSTQRFKSAPDNLLDIAKQLGVANILEGSVQHSAGQVRVNVQLIKAATDAHLWADTYDRKLSDIFTVETEIATKIADTLQAKLSGSEHRAIAARPTENMEAHELYLKGRYFGGKRTAADLQRAINYYNQALAKDPNYAIAYAGIANCYALLQEYSNLTATEAFPKAQAAATRALAIDDNLGEAHAALAFVMAQADFNLTGAKREFERAIELNPNSSDAHYFFGVSVLLPLGQFDQAIAELKHAIALDPFSVIMNANLGLVYIYARRYPEAIAQLRKTAELDPNSRQVHSRLGNALLLSGDVPGAIAEYEKQRELAQKDGQGREYYAVMFLAHLYGVSGNREKALKMSDEARHLEQRTGPVAWGNALIQIGLANKEEAIDWLERSYEAKEGGISDIKVNPFLDPLRNEPRFQALVAKVFSTGKSSTPSP